MKYLPIRHHVHCVCWAWSVFRSDCQDIVIIRKIKENISHNIFYTAITRAKKYLKIYWSPETQQYIIKNFNIKNNKIDVSILKAKERI